MSDPIREKKLDIDDVSDAMTPAHGIATSDYVKRKMADAERELELMLKRHDNKLTWRSVFVAVGSVAAGVISAIVFIDNRVAAQSADAGRVAAAEAKAIDARVTTLEKRFDRFDQKMDAALDALRVPESKRPAPMDGGR